MNILITGKLDTITNHLVAAAGSNRVILAAKKIPPGEFPGNVRSFTIEPTDNLFERVTRVGSFDAAVYFMARGEHTDQSEGGVTAFQNMLEHCMAGNVGQIILVSSGEVYSGLPEGTAISDTTPASPKGTQGFQIKAAEDMCQQYWKQESKNITIVRLPLIYQRDNALAGDGLMANLFNTVAGEHKKFELPGSPDTSCDFLSDLEAARLIWLIIDEGISSKSLFVNAGTGKPTTMVTLANLVTQNFPGFMISYSGDSSDVSPPMRTKIAKTEYGWNAINNLTDDFVQIKNSLSVKPVNRLDFIIKKILKLIRFFRGTKGFIVAEFAIATALLQLLTTALKSFTFASWIDLRLLFVVILSSLHGTIPGIVAGAIGGVMLFFSFGGTNWRMIVYNPENWIPFGLYIIMGVALGSKVDRQGDTVKSIEDKLDLAEKTNIYLVELYDEAVKIKDKYRDQILSYKDNFGRIYSIVKKLNAEMSEYVFSSAIEVMEDVLENNSVAIYSMSTRGDYARMTVCSKEIHDGIAMSMRMHDYAQIMEKVEQHDIFFNQALIPGFPSYCAPVYNEEKLIALVMIWRAEVDQMTLHYSNLFRILSGLIQESLVRAVKYNKLRESMSYFQDTRIMMKGPFLEAYKANLVLAEQEQAEFCLLIANRKGDMVEQSDHLEACIRESDILGEINDDYFGIILKNVSEEAVATLLERFRARKIKAEQVTVTKMNDLMLKEAG